MELIEIAAEIAAEFIRNNPAEGMGLMALGFMVFCWIAKDWII